jgi:mono/diheme cytochrome c family protein
MIAHDAQLPLTPLPVLRERLGEGSKQSARLHRRTHGAQTLTPILSRSTGRGSMAFALIMLCMLVAGCWEDQMADGSRIKPHEEPPRPLLAGTVPRGGRVPRVINDPMYAVTAPPAGQPAASFPFPLNAKDLEIGQKNYNIFCAVCHGATGKGDGMIVQRGFPRPPSLYLDRLRNAPHGHFYNVITHGYGAMYSYHDRIEPDDRWRIVGYVRALQLSDPNDRGADTPTTQRK